MSANWVDTVSLQVHRFYLSQQSSTRLSWQTFEAGKPRFCETLLHETAEKFSRLCYLIERVIDQRLFNQTRAAHLVTVKSSATFENSFSTDMWDLPLSQISSFGWRTEVNETKFWPLLTGPTKHRKPVNQEFAWFCSEFNQSEIDDLMPKLRSKWSPKDLLFQIIQWLRCFDSNLNQHAYVCISILRNNGIAFDLNSFRYTFWRMTTSGLLWDHADRSTSFRRSGVHMTTVVDS